MIKRIEIVTKYGIIYLGEPYQVKPKFGEQEIEEMKIVMSRHSIAVSEIERWCAKTVG